MPTTINVGLSKKIGIANYGSLGASCSVEFEVSHGLMDDDLNAFHRKVQNAFTACRQAVTDELARQQVQAGGTDANCNRTNVPSAPATTPSNGNGQRRSNGRKATASQILAIHAIVNRQGLDLVQTLRERCGVEYADELGIAQASQLIDDLKALTNGAGGRR